MDNNVWVGVTLPIHDPFNKQSGGIGLCASGLRPHQFDKLWDQRSVLAINLAASFDAMTRLPLIDANSPLTDRQKSILSYLSNGLPPKAISDKLPFSTTTVIRELAMVRQSLGAGNH